MGQDFPTLRLLIIFSEYFLKNSSGKEVLFDTSARLKARKDPEAWPEILENGRDRALYIFANKVSILLSVLTIYDL